ncbi:MAG: ribonuclease P protein component [Acidimicrobiales bacterium]
MASLGRVRRRSTFSRLKRPVGRAVAGPLKVGWIPDREGKGTLVAYSISRRCGSAVVRNRLRRRLREAARATEVKEGIYLVVATPEATRLGFGELSATLGSAMNAAAARGTRR